MSKQKFNFAKIERFQKSYKSPKEKIQGEYVKFGDDNKRPQYLIDLYNNSSIHAAAINATVEAIIGEGLVADQEVYLKKANSLGESWNDLFTKAASDYKLHGGYALEIIWSLDRSRIAEVYHIDFSKVRACEKDAKGRIPAYVVCDSWNSYKKDMDDMEYLPVFNPMTKDECPNQIYVCKQYRPGQDYYPLPDYNGALNVVELDVEVDKFHVNNIQNGLAPSIAITTFTGGDAEDMRFMQESLKANYAGPENAGSLMLMDVQDKEQAPTITPIPQNGADGYYTTINDMVLQKILTGHRITSPMMLGIKTAGQLGGKDEVVDAFNLFFNTVVSPMQQDILKGLEYILEFNFPGITLGVTQKKLYSDGEEEREVVTSVETENEDTQDIQNDVDQITENQ